MSKKLFVVESPGKVRKISQILGPGWIVKASMGHIRELSNRGEYSLGFTFVGNTIECDYLPRGNKGKQTIAQLRAAAKQVDAVVLATDDDREGETIAFHLQEVLGLKNPQRVVYSEITAPAIQSAIARPRSIDMDLVNAGRARDCLDKLVGYRGSPLLWSLNNGAKSCGRVQSAALHLLCEREREIQVFTPQDYWVVYADYAEGYRAYYLGELDPGIDSEQELDGGSDDANDNNSQAPESTRVLTQAEAERLVQSASHYPHQVIQVKAKITTRQPPAPFTTSTLQQAAGSKLHLSPDQTMKLAQKLYEVGAITYMRTDSTALSPEFCATARQWLEQHDPENIPQQLAKHRSAKNAQAAHEAIRPTDLTKASAQLKTELTPEEFQLYVLIWKRALASQCQPARLQKTQILTRSGAIFWQARGQVVEFLGYARYWHNLSEDAELPTLVQGQSLCLAQAGYSQKQTQPPPRFSEPKLVQMMERSGIGRPSTYASTIATLKQRQYVQVIKGNLQPTALGLEVDQFMVKVLPDLVKSEFTAQMEQALDAIAAGEQDWQQYLISWNQSYFAPALAAAYQVLGITPSSIPGRRQPTELSAVLCPQCDRSMQKIPCRSKKLQADHFLKCSDPDCEAVMFWSQQKQEYELPLSQQQKLTSTSLPPTASKQSKLRLLVLCQI